jgi:hypothetical protein
VENGAFYCAIFWCEGIKKLFLAFSSIRKEGWGVAHQVTGKT